MADTQNINAVTDLQSIDGNDSILVSDSNTSLGKINYNKLAKAIIESYTGSSLAGQSVSIQQAFSTLNSNTNTPQYSSMATLYNDGVAMVPGHTSKIIVLEASLVSSITNNSVAGACRAIMTKMDASTIDITAWGLASEKEFMCRLTSASTVSKCVIMPTRTEVDTLNSNLSSLYCREYSYAAGTSYKDAVTDVLSKLGSTVARYWIIITIGASRLSLMIIKDGVQWSNGILTSYAATCTEVYFVMSRAGQSGETVVFIRKLLTGDLEE